MRATLPASLLLVLAAAATACSAATPSDATPVSAAVTSDGTRAPLVTAVHGRAKRVAEALAGVTLRADQRVAVDALAADTESHHATGLAARQAVTDMLAAQIEAGAIDREAIAPRIDAMVTVHRDVEAKDRAGFEALHELLDAGQRTEFAEAMQSHGRPHDGERDWKGRDHGPGDRWADELGLSDDQRAAFKAILHESFAGMRGGDHAFHGGPHGRALLEAFKADTFSIDAVSPPEDMGAKASAMAGHVLDIAEKVLPLLTPGQRAVAAQKIRERGEMLVPLGPGL